MNTNGPRPPLIHARLRLSDLHSFVYLIYQYWLSFKPDPIILKVHASVHASSDLARVRNNKGVPYRSGRMAARTWMDSLSRVELAPRLHTATEIHYIPRLVASYVVVPRTPFGQVMLMHAPPPSPGTDKPPCNSQNTVLLLFHLFKSNTGPTRFFILPFIFQLDGHNVVLHKALWQEHEPCPLG